MKAADRRSTLINMSRTVAELADELLDAQKLYEQLNQVSINDQHRATGLRAQITRLENDVVEAKTQIDSITSQLTDSDTLLIKTQDERVNLISQLAHLENKVDAADELSIKFRSESTDLRKMLAEMENQRDEMASTIAAFNSVKPLRDDDVTEMIYNGRKELFEVIREIGSAVPEKYKEARAFKLNTTSMKACSQILKLCEEALS